MKKSFALLALVASFALFSFAAPKDTTLTGTINDAKCSAQKPPMVDAACAAKCAAAGQPMVLVVDKSNKVYKIANQDAIKDHVGHHVTVTGSVKGDTVTITKVTMVGA